MKANKQKGSERPTISIVIHSWDTALACFATLVIGLVMGFIARPLVTVSTPTPAPAAARVLEDQNAFETKANADPKGIMTTALKQVKHFMGSENAPVTMLEFADFQ